MGQLWDLVERVDLPYGGARGELIRTLDSDDLVYRERGPSISILTVFNVRWSVTQT
jgi:hypothetical protein